MNHIPIWLNHVERKSCSFNKILICDSSGLDIVEEGNSMAFFDSIDTITKNLEYEGEVSYTWFRRNFVLKILSSDPF